MSKIIIKQNKDEVIVDVETTFYILEPQKNVRYLWRVYKKVDDAWISINSDYFEGTSTKRTFNKEAEGNKYEVRVYKIVDAKNKNGTKDKYKDKEINILYLGSSEVFPKSINSIRNVKPEILEVHLIKKGTGSISKVSYQDTLIAIAKTKGLEGEKITFNLYERDEKDRTHVKDFLAKVDRYGMARVEIPLLSNKKVFQFLANQKAPENGEGTKHEFFVTASFGLNKNMITKDSNEVQAHLKKNIKNAYFVDANGKKVNKLQVGDTVCVCIESEDMIGTLVRYTILEKDVINDDVIWVRKLVINDDVHTDSEITITENLFNEGADLGYVDSDSEKQNYYIKVEAYAGIKESSAFELSFESVEFEVGKSPVKVEVDDGKKKEAEEEKEEKDKNTIYITRKWEKWTGENKNSATYGTFVFDDLTGFICEPYGPETTERNKDKRIPVGTYNLEWYPESPSFPKNVYTKNGRYATNPDPKKAIKIDCPELKNGIIRLFNKDVPKDRYILFHAGYHGGWTKGCINPFRTLVRKKTTKEDLEDSVSLLLEIYEKIDKIGIEKVKIVITDEIDKTKNKEDEKYEEIIKKRVR